MNKRRKILFHAVPAWVDDGAEYFITICCQPKGLNQLCRKHNSLTILNAMRFYESRGDLWLHLLLLMPDHLHAIISFNRDPGMSRSIREFKKYAARKTGINWQRDFFDHRLRNDESYIEKAHYIRMNPVRAGLCRQPENWPYIWESRSC